MCAIICPRDKTRRKKLAQIFWQDSPFFGSWRGPPGKIFRRGIDPLKRHFGKDFRRQKPLLRPWHRCSSQICFGYSEKLFRSYRKFPCSECIHVFFHSVFTRVSICNPKRGFLSFPHFEIVQAKAKHPHQPDRAGQKRTSDPKILLLHPKLTVKKFLKNISSNFHSNFCDLYYVFCCDLKSSCHLGQTGRKKVSQGQISPGPSWGNSLKKTAVEREKEGKEN